MKDHRKITVKRTKTPETLSRSLLVNMTGSKCALSPWDISRSRSLGSLGVYYVPRRYVPPLNQTEIRRPATSIRATRLERSSENKHQRLSITSLDYPNDPETNPLPRWRLELRVTPQVSRTRRSELPSAIPSTSIKVQGS